MRCLKGALPCSQLCLHASQLSPHPCLCLCGSSSSCRPSPPLQLCQLCCPLTGAGLQLRSGSIQLSLQLLGLPLRALQRGGAALPSRQQLPLPRPHAALEAVHQSSEGRQQRRHGPHLLCRPQHCLCCCAAGCCCPAGSQHCSEAIEGALHATQDALELVALCHHLLVQLCGLPLGAGCRQGCSCCALLLRCCCSLCCCPGGACRGLGQAGLQAAALGPQLLQGPLRGSARGLRSGSRRSSSHPALCLHQGLCQLYAQGVALSADLPQLGEGLLHLGHEGLLLGAQNSALFASAGQGLHSGRGRQAVGSLVIRHASVQHCCHCTCALAEPKAGQGCRPALQQRCALQVAQGKHCSGVARRCSATLWCLLCCWH